VISRDPQRGAILIYDAQCRLCTTAKEGLERLSASVGRPTIRFVPYQSDEAADRLGSEYRPGRPNVAFLVDAEGTIHRGLDAFLPLLPGLPGGRFLLAVMRVPLLRPLGYLLYRLVARYRYRLFGQVPCDAGCQVEGGKPPTRAGRSGSAG
jgi:predicted DCC family thiol-disulfide oxidoreductase YuxK